MTYKEYAEKAKEILEAIKNGNYEENLGAICDLAPSFSDVDEQAAAYARAMGIEHYEAYWCEDEDCPCEDEGGDNY